MTMRERIARAISVRRLREDPNFSWSEEEVEQLSALNWTHNLPDADAVLSAMREPTEGMMCAGARSHMEGVNYHGPIWAAMIDAAKEGA